MHKRNAGRANDSGDWRFVRDGEFVERDCLLFEAGDYPDRGVSISPDDLREIARNTQAAIPVKVEHLNESPFDGALGMITRVRAVGGQLWGTLRQPVEAWQFLQKAGARALSVALDVAGRRLVETSFVCRPRIPAARVFAADPASRLAVFHSAALFETESGDSPEPGAPKSEPEKENGMTTVRQFAEGLMQYMRSALRTSESAESAAPESDPFAQERAEIEAQRELVRNHRVEQQIADFKRQGLMRATREAEDLARILLRSGETATARFHGADAPISLLFTRFLKENGAVVPVGEVIAADLSLGGRPSDRLIALARDKARAENLGYVAAFSQVTRVNPDLARAAREEALHG